MRYDLNPPYLGLVAENPTRRPVYVLLTDEDDQRNEDITPYWRTLKSDGELNVKYPEAIELQKKLLEEEGHTIISKGTKNIKYYVKDFEKNLIEL